MWFRWWMAGCLIAVVPVHAGTNGTIIVSASRLDDLDLMAVDTAADVTVVDRAVIEGSGAVSVPELLRSEANLLIRNTSGSPNDAQVSMRGFGENSHLRTLILVDGHRLNRPDMGVAGWESIPISSIERIEVIRGGQNVLYGDQALAGVVQITTRRGANAGTRLGGSIGSFGYISGFAGYGASVGDLDTYVGIDRYASDGFRSNSASRATTLSGNVVWYAGDTDTLTLRGSGTASHRQFPGALSYDQFQQDPTQSTSPGNEYADTDSGQATMIWETERAWGAARVASGYNVRDMNWVLGGIYANNRQQGASVGPRVKIGDDDDFVMAGCDAFYDWLDFEDLHPQDPRYVQARAALERRTLQPYGFIQRTTRRGWVLGAGARYEYARTDNRFDDYVDNQILPTIDTNRSSSPNPNYRSSPDIDPTNSYAGVVSKDGWAATLSLSKDYTKNGSGWIRYDRVYRYPTLDETASYQGYPLSDPLNENLDPETGDNIEVGIRRTTDRWNASWSTYCLLMDNEIVFVDNGTERLNKNIGKTRRIGSEIELQYDREWYGASTRWALQDARLCGGENDGNRVPLVPWAYGICSAWIDPSDEVRLTVDWSYVSSQYRGGDEANENPRLAAYGLLGCRANVKMAESARLVVSIDNLLDKTYATTAYGGAYYPGTGRSIRMGFTLEF